MINISVYSASFLPNSCGSSCTKTAMEVDRPPRKSSLKAAPMARPSAKLCIASPKMMIQTNDVKPVSHKNKPQFTYTLVCLILNMRYKNLHSR